METDNPMPSLSFAMVFKGKPVSMNLSFAYKGDYCWHVSIDNYHQGRMRKKGGCWRDVDKKFTDDEVYFIGHNINKQLKELNATSIYL